MPDLAVGRYVAVCAEPAGTTSPQRVGKGRPHFQLGMQRQFSVS
jgi:hypothetical protein